jgi:hypothetical protein
MPPPPPILVTLPQPLEAQLASGSPNVEYDDVSQTLSIRLITGEVWISAVIPLPDAVPACVIDTISLTPKLAAQTFAIKPTAAEVAAIEKHVEQIDDVEGAAAAIKRELSGVPSHLGMSIEALNAALISIYSKRAVLQAIRDMCVRLASGNVTLRSSASSKQPPAKSSRQPPQPPTSSARTAAAAPESGIMSGFLDSTAAMDEEQPAGADDDAEAGRLKEQQDKDAEAAKLKRLMDDRKAREAAEAEATELAKTPAQSLAELKLSAAWAWQELADRARAVLERVKREVPTQAKAAAKTLLTFGDFRTATERHNVGAELFAEAKAALQHYEEAVMASFAWRVSTHAARSAATVTRELDEWLAQMLPVATSLSDAAAGLHRATKGVRHRLMLFRDLCTAGVLKVD